VFQLGDLSTFVYADVVRMTGRKGRWIWILTAFFQFRDAQPFQGGTYQWDVAQMLWAMVSPSSCILK
jgi:hypothetical protein